MSVPTGEREDGKFTLPIKAEFLCRYTLNITTNEKVFTPAYQRALTDDIIATAKNVYLGIRMANDTTVRVGSVYQMRDWLERNSIQRRALVNCKRLLYLIDIAHRVFHLSSKRVKYWATLTIEVRNRIQGWIDSDTERFET